MPSPEAVGAMTRVKIAPAPAPLSSVANRATARRDVPGGRSQEKLPSRASPTEAMYPAAGTPPAPTPAPAVAPAALARHRGTCKGDTYPSGPDPDRRSWIASSRATPLPLCHDGRGPPPAATCAPLALGGSRACGHAWPCQARLQLPRPPLPPAPPSRLPPAHRAAHEDVPASRRRCPPAPGGPSCCVSLTRAPPPHAGHCLPVARQSSSLPSGCRCRLKAFRCLCRRPCRGRCGPPPCPAAGAVSPRRGRRPLCLLASSPSLPRRVTLCLFPISPCRAVPTAVACTDRCGPPSLAGCTAGGSSPSLPRCAPFRTRLPWQAMALPAGM